jgi:hypothetical protein
LTKTFVFGTIVSPKKEGSMRTFADLQQDEKVSAAEVAEVLKDYAMSGAGISAAVVISLVNRTRPSDTERKQMKASAQKGKEDQARRGHTRDAAEYGKVVQRLTR